MKFIHRFRVQAPIAWVAEFHSRASSLPAITPPPIAVRLIHVPEVLTSGDEMDFSMGFGPLQLRWLARIEGVSPTEFTDRQLKGPFATWVHRHSFAAIDGLTTEVLDEVTFALRPTPGWWLIGLGMRLSLPFLFAFRGWKTRRLLKNYWSRTK